MLKRTSHQCLQPISLPALLGVSARLLPCGKCPNCLKRKANELVVRVDRQLQGRNVTFLTFTYDNEHCPIYRKAYMFDKDTGEVLASAGRFVDFPQFFERADYVWRTNKKHFKVMRFKVYEECDIYDDYGFSYEYYMSLRYDDIKGCFKRVRVNHEFGDFLLVPEYGGAGYRPHYHMLCIGFSDSCIEALVSDWQSHFGAVDVRRVECKDLDSVRKLSSYITKYCSKGRFDCPYIFSGNCQKPRRSQSLNFGCGSDADFKKLCNVLKRVDLYGDYDLNVVPDGFAPAALSCVRSYNINGYSYPMPKYLIRKIFFNHGKEISADGKVRYFSRATPVQKEVSASILADLVCDFKRKAGDDDLVNSRSLSSDSVIHSDDEKALYYAAVSHFVGDLECNSIY